MKKVLKVLKWIGIAFIGSIVLVITLGIIVDANKTPEQKAADATEAVVSEQEQVKQDGQGQVKKEQEQTTKTNTSEPRSQLADATSVKLTRDKIASIENEFSAEQDKFNKLMVDMVKGKKLSKKEIEKLNKLFNIQIEKMNAILDKSESITIIEFENEDAKRYLTEAVDYHKKWALAHKAQLNSFLIANLDEAKRYGALSDSFADQEALSLVMAYQSVGLELPH